MVGTRKCQRLAEHVTAAGGKLIGIGDSRQLSEIEAGGAFRAISERLGAVHLPGNRRQLDPEEIRALVRLREGDADAYVLFEHQRGRITVADDPSGAMRAQPPDWWQAAERHPEHESVLVALHRSNVAELNANAHALIRDARRLGDAEITVDDRSFAAGDRVVLLRNNATLDVDNGDRGLILNLDPDRRAITVALDARREVRTPDWYLDARWVDHGYALTAHKLQIPTVDRTFALASDRLYQEAGYSIATPARHKTHFYLAYGSDLADHERAHGPPQPPEDAIARFARQPSASRAQTLVSDEPAHARPRALSTTDSETNLTVSCRHSATSPPAKHALTGRPAGGTAACCGSTGSSARASSPTRRPKDRIRPRRFCPARRRCCDGGERRLSRPGF